MHLVSYRIYIYTSSGFGMLDLPPLTNMSDTEYSEL